MATPSPITRSTPWRHLYRSLLRECTYLPDPIALDYMRQYVRSNFRENRSSIKPEGSKPQKGPILHRRCRKLLSLLQRANEGYLKSLEKVLLLSYGRIGQRRWTLLRPLHPGFEKAMVFDDNWKPPKELLMLVRDQSRQRAVSELRIRPHVKVFEPPIPKENIWGRPTPVKRRVNIRKRWYSNLLNSCLPLLPEVEWATVQDLATGKGEWTPPKRRKRPVSTEISTLLTPHFLVYGPDKGFTFERYLRGRPHIITRRLMTNFWKKVCVLTPKMTWNDTKQRWIIKWGVFEPPTRTFSRKLDPEKGLALFEGLDSKTGKILAQGQK